MKKKTGKFVVLEGNQGLGKTTQVRLLETYLKTNNIYGEVFYFPNYDSFFGKMAKRFLKGDFGTLDNISPYFVALIFANDRALDKDKILDALKMGKLVICDRWIASNMAIQASKINNVDSRQEFIEWINELEFSIFGQPFPDLTIYLRASPEYSLLNLRKRLSVQNASDDIEEASENLIKDSFYQYEYLASIMNNWITLELEKTNCEETSMLTVEETHGKILDLLRMNDLIP